MSKQVSSATPPKHSTGKALITAHRGMGVLEKPRSEYLAEEVVQNPDVVPPKIVSIKEKFLPENSIAAFKEAIRQGADALECDIHVSKDGVPVVIHGPALGKYADYHSNYRGNPKVETTTFDNLNKYYRLKGADLNDPDQYRIPTLWDYLQLAYDENKLREKSGLPPLKLNIELKGEGSAVASLGCITAFYNQNIDVARYIAPENMVFLGRHDRQEIAIANSMLKREINLYEEMCKDVGVDPKKGIASVREQAAVQAKICGMERKAFLVSIPEQLGKAKTNVILSTVDLFGKGATKLLDEQNKRIPNEDCDTSLDIKEISLDGTRKIEDAFIKHKYNGIDISLYDFTPGVKRDILYAIAYAGIDPKDVCIGVSASGWKGSEKEASLTGPSFAVTRTDAIAHQLGVDVLLKVDEPGMFKALLERSRRAELDKSDEPKSLSELSPKELEKLNAKILDPFGSINGMRRLGYDVDVDHVIAVDSGKGKHLDVPVEKVSSKPPRGAEKELPKKLPKALLKEINNINKNLKKAGVAEKSCPPNSPISAPATPNVVSPEIELDPK